MGRRNPWYRGPYCFTPFAKRSTSFEPMLQAAASGKMSTLALPATSLGRFTFFAPTRSSMAASVWNSPSILRSGRIFCARANASRIFLTGSLEPPLPSVE